MKTKRYYYILITLMFIGGISFILSCDKEKDINLPQTNRLTIETDSVKSVLYHTAMAYGSIGELKNITIQQYGHCWDTIEIPTIESNKTLFSNLTSHITFNSNLADLKPAKKYYVRSYAKSTTLTAYSEISSFTTKSLEPPTLTSDSIRDITSTTVKIWGAIKLDGGTTISARGVCWGTAINPTLTSQHAETNSLTNVFSTPITGLTRNTLYHVRVYATNQSGTAYGNDLTFTTNAELPQITTTAITGITANTAIGGGNITSDGSAAITAKGVCWGLTESPTLSNSHTTDGTGSGIFTSNITGLQAGKTYYVRAYAMNSMGTVFGNQENFATPAIPPTLTTTAINNITLTTASSGGNLINNGGATITDRGICWSTIPQPTITDNHTTEGAGEGSFNSNLSGLTNNTTYFVRAFATNIAGTSYGNEISFTTVDGFPIITTTPITSIMIINAISGGNITNDFGYSVTARGVCWSTSPNPTILSSVTSDGIGTGAFISNVTGLMANTTYYVRAYATNILGTGYGNVLTFTTLPISGGTFTDIEGNIYHTVTIGTQVWMVENLKTTKYRDGNDISNVTDNTAWLNQTVGAYCWYNNDINNKNIYGALYNFYTIVDSHNLCPTGWHVPTDSEWIILENYLGGSSVAGGKLKATTLWYDGNIGATNESGFTAYPSGYRQSNYNFDLFGYYSYFWTSTESSTTTAKGRMLGWNYANTVIVNDINNKSSGYSIRCIRN